MAENTFEIAMSVNGQTVAGRVEGRTLLTDFLRRNAGLTGPRFGCEEGSCGACTVAVNGDTIKSCLMLAVQADGADVLTAEGVAEDGELSKVQQAFVQCHAVQCGYCTAGMVMSTRDFLNRHPDGQFTEEELREALSGNYCRCTGYNHIFEAAKVAAGRAQPLAKLESEIDAKGGFIGQPIARREDRRLVMGGGRYVDNHTTPGDLYLGIVRSTRAHARILAIDVSKAEAAPGVVRVVTGKEALPRWQPIAPSIRMDGLNLPERHAMASDKVIFFGEPVAFVLANTPEQAEDAAALVAVEYADLPVNVDMLKAAAEPAGSDALLYPAWGTNLQRDFQFEIGPVDDTFAKADLVVDEVITSHRYGAMPMETRVTWAHFEPGERRLTMRASTQVPHQIRLYLSQVFGIPEARIQVLAGDVGGGFGAKLSVDVEHVVALASIISGRPVKYFESRREWLHSGPAARDIHTRSRAAFRADGRILALETDIFADMGCDGAERACGLGMPINGGLYTPSAYRVDTYRTRVRCVVTNKAPYSAYRGYGKDIANLFIERVIDQAAQQLGLDPVEVRRINLLETYPHQICTGAIIENGSLREALDRVVEMMDLPGLRRLQSQARAEGRYLGYSLASYIEPSGFAFPGSTFQNYESATVRVAADGSVHVMTGIQNIGQGIETAYAQVTADALGCALSDVNVSWGDTTAIPFGSGTYSSRGAMYAIGAIVAAAATVRERLVQGGAVYLDCAPEEIEIENGVISRRGWDAHCTLRELAYAAYVQPGAEIILTKADGPLLESTNTYRHPQVNWQADTQGRAQVYPSHPGGAAGAWVEVDPSTGRVDVKKIWMVSDHGVVLNPVILTGQTKGAVVQQIGGTLYEWLGYDERGVPLANTLKDYGMPTVWAAPEIEVEHLVTPSPATRIGAKGAGEDGCIATSTVLMGAVENALAPFGVKVMDSTLFPAKVHALIEAARSRSRA
ncbi:MAG: molybdopterin-dependent oxidoreductase [Gammaproteobacteria bacterium]|nr:molybdopterin-dependent oxidoreductase [Gammaproteobacteria bacterium]